MGVLCHSILCDTIPHICLFSFLETCSIPLVLHFCSHRISDASYDDHNQRAVYEEGVFRVNEHPFFGMRRNFHSVSFPRRPALEKFVFHENVPFTFGFAVWAVVQVDLCVKLISLVLKTILFFCISKLHWKHKGRPYHLFEQVFDIYRVLIPLGIWIRYCLSLPLLVIILIMPLYIIHKAWNVIGRCIPLLKNIKYLLQRGPRYGKYVTTEITVESGQTCSICMDLYQNPVVLECDHIFCEECVNQWFLKEKSCPICRHEVPGRGEENFVDGSSDATIAIC
jgi:hypothetical protein